MLKSSYWSAASQPITRRCGVGCSDMAPNWNCGYDGISRPPTSRGALTRPTLRSKAAGAICIGRSIRQARRLISCCRPFEMPMPPNGYFAKLCATDRIHSLASSTRIWHPSIPPRSPAIKKEGTLRRRCRHRPVQYLNNIIEQDHRAIKRRVNAKQGFREFQAARRTIQGYEVIHMMRKGQVRWVSGTDIRRQNQFINNVFELAA
jgi:hypothetical protein